MKCFVKRYLVLIAAVMCVTSNGWSQTIPLFPFDEPFDGSIDDDMPVSWVEGGRTNGTFEFSTGDLVLKGPNVSTVTSKDGIVLSAIDSSAQTQLGLTGSNSTFATVFTRSPDADSAYGGGIEVSGRIFAAETSPSGVSNLVILLTDLRPAIHDVVLQLDTVGTMTTLSAWDARSPKPEDPPSVSIRDNSLTEGPFGLALSGDSASIASFRYFNIVPEPSAIGLATFGILGLLGGRPRRRTANRD